jgi:hypothetical protein
MCKLILHLHVLFFQSSVYSLFGRFAVEVLVIGLRFGAGMVDDAVPMIRGRIERVGFSGTLPILMML